MVIIFFLLNGLMKYDYKLIKIIERKGEGRRKRVCDKGWCIRKRSYLER